MIANPWWLEISSTLFLKQTLEDCLNLIARIFEVKNYELIEDIYKHHILEHSIARQYFIEFQKKCLLHLHF